MLTSAQNDETNVLQAIPDFHAVACVEKVDERSLAPSTRSEVATSGNATTTGSHSQLPDLGDRYRLIKKLGQGGMGAVFLAEDLHLHRSVAIKVLPPEFNLDQQAVQRFQKEVRMLSEVQHPNVANLLDSGVRGNTRFIVMELVDES